MIEPVIEKNVIGIHSFDALRQLTHFYNQINKKRPAIIIVGRGFHYDYYRNLGKYVSPELTPNNVNFQGIEVLLSDSVEEYEVRMY